MPFLVIALALAACTEPAPQLAPGPEVDRPEEEAPGRTTPTPTPELTLRPGSVIVALSPGSGPCDATVEVRGEGLAPSVREVRMGLSRLGGAEAPGHDLGGATVDDQGRFRAEITFGATGCEQAAWAPPGSPPPAQPNRLHMALYDATGGPPFTGLIGTDGRLAGVLYTPTTREPSPERRDLRLPGWPQSWNRPLGSG